MTKLDRIVEAGEDWHIERLLNIADDLRVMATAYQQMGPQYSLDMPQVIDTTLERLTRLKGQISDEDSNRIPDNRLIGTGYHPTD